MNTLPDRSVTHVGKLYCHLCTEVQHVITHRKDGNMETNITALDFNREYQFHVRLYSAGFKELQQKRFKFVAKSWDDITLS